MITLNILGRGLLIVSIIFFTSATLESKTVEIQSSVNKTMINLSDSINYTISIAGTNEDPILPSFEFFSIVSRSRSQQIQFINGSYSSLRKIQLTLVPQKVGKLTIAPTKVVVDSKTYSTQAITIHVNSSQSQSAQSSSPSSSNSRTSQHRNYSKTKEIYIESRVSKNSPFEGEMLIYELVLLRRINLWSDIAFQIPEFEGVWKEDLQQDENERSTIINGHRYIEKVLQRIALFPISSGPLLIKQARAGFVKSPLQGQIVIESPPVTLNVQPLPEKNRPLSFSGGVGEFTLSSTPIPNTAKTGVPITVKLWLKGKGNIKNISSLAFDESKKLKVYQSNVTDQINNIDSIQGTRAFEYIIIPRSTGLIMSPSFSFTYFDPEKIDYVTLKTEPISIQVKQGKSQSTNASGANFNDLEPSKSDIRYLKPVSLPLTEKPNIQTRLFLALLINLTLTLLLLSRYYYNKLAHKNLPLQNKKNAYKVAIKKINTLKTLRSKDLGQKLNFILKEYLSNRLMIDLYHFTNEDIGKLLSRYSLKKELIENCVSTLENLSYLSYSPDAIQEDISKTIQKLCALLKNTEKELKEL